MWTMTLTSSEEDNTSIQSILIHWVVRGTGTPKDKDEVDRREVCQGRVDKSRKKLNLL